jgi:hypothetical protein
MKMSINPATAPLPLLTKQELNVFGSPTGAVVHVREGDRLPSAPRSFTGRRLRQDACYSPVGNIGDTRHLEE